MNYHYNETDSTSAVLARMIAADAALPMGTVVSARYQTAGRGQRGNGWVSAPGENLLFSILLRPDIPATHLFRLSQIVALAVVDILHDYTIEALVKWPNDIYVGTRKLAGILIENTMTDACVAYSVVGVGLNVNQLFDTPIADVYPISMRQVTGKTYDCMPILQKLTRCIVSAVERYMPACDHKVDMRYSNILFRREGVHRYYDCIADEEIFASFLRVEPSGRLVLLTDRGEERSYYFKEIKYIL